MFRLWQVRPHMAALQCPQSRGIGIRRLIWRSSRVSFWLMSISRRRTLPRKAKNQAQRWKNPLKPARKIRQAFSLTRRMDSFPTKANWHRTISRPSAWPQSRWQHSKTPRRCCRLTKRRRERSWRWKILILSWSRNIWVLSRRVCSWRKSYRQHRRDYRE